MSNCIKPPETALNENKFKRQNIERFAYLNPQSRNRFALIKSSFFVHFCIVVDILPLYVHITMSIWSESIPQIAIIQTRPPFRDGATKAVVPYRLPHLLCRRSFQSATLFCHFRDKNAREGMTFDRNNGGCHCAAALTSALALVLSPSNT